MKNIEERKLYEFNMEGYKAFVSLTESQVRLINWLEQNGYDFELTEMDQNAPIVI